MSSHSDSLPGQLDGEGEHFVFHAAGSGEQPRGSGSPSPTPFDSAHLLPPAGGRKKRDLPGSSSRSPSSSARGPAASSSLSSSANSRNSSTGGALVQAMASSSSAHAAAMQDAPTSVVRLHFASDDSTPLSSAPSPAGRSVSPTAAKPSVETLLLVNEADTLVKQLLAASFSAHNSASSPSSSSAAADSPESRLRSFGSYHSRLVSFGNHWPHTPASHPLLSPATLAAWGLFRHSSADGDCPLDCTMCFACSAEMHDWEPSDDPEESHRQAQLSTLVPCPFLEAMDRVREAQGFSPRIGGGSNRPLELLLQDIDDDDNGFGQEYASDADDDALPPLIGSSGLPSAMARTHSAREQSLIQINETEADKRRAVRCTNSAAVQVDGLRVRMTSGSNTNQLQPVVAQLRQPLQPFQAFGGTGSPSFLYFQVRIVQLTNTPLSFEPESNGSFAPGGAKITSEDKSPLIHRSPAGSPHSLPSSSGALYPPLVIGLSTSSLHAQSLPPGFDPPSGNDLLSAGVTSRGDLNLNGMGPLSGLVSMQNAPFWPYNAGNGLEANARVWKEGDVIGCKVCLERGVMYWHINGEQLGPVLIPRPSTIDSGSSAVASPASLSSFHFFPTISLLHPGDCVELQVSTSAIAFNSGNPGSLMQSVDLVSAEGARSLLDSWRFDDDEAVINRALARLSQERPDLGLVLDQANLARKAESPAAGAPRGSPQNRSGSVGIEMTTITPASRSIPGPVTISKILPGFSADQAGLRVGDQVRAIDDACIVLLRDAVSVVTAALPATVMRFEILRSGRTFVVPLTLGAKGIDEGTFGPLARWAQFSRRNMEWIGPPVRTSSPGLMSGASAPPTYDAKMAATRLTGIEHIRALEVSLLVEARLTKYQTPLYLPLLKTLSARMNTFTGQMQAWMHQRDVGSSSSLAQVQPPKPLNVAIHGFAYAPVAGFPGRVVCFSCGAIVSSVRNVHGLLEEHRELARQKHSASVMAASSYVGKLERPPSYHRNASLLPENLDAGCLFLTLYDSAVASLSAKAQAKIAVTTAAAKRAQGAPAARSSLPPSSPPEVVIDVEADDEQLLPATSHSSNANTPANKARKQMGGPILSNRENLARESAASSPQSFGAGSTSLPPPDYAVAVLAPSLHVGAKLSAHPDHEGIVWQSALQVNPRQARAGEFTQGSVDLRGRQPLNSVELRARNRGREAAPRWGEGGHRNDDIEQMVLPEDPFVGPPPPPPQPPMEVLKEFFCGGNPIFLFCKVPFFIIVLPFFLIYELVKGLWNGAIWCCDAIDRTCTRCCGACGRLCNRCCDCFANYVGRCCNFICCDILCDGICTPLYNGLAWVCKKMDHYCFTPIYRCLQSCCATIGRCCSAIGKAISDCCSAIGRAISSCCSWINQTCCAPIGRCIASCCRAIGNCISATCDAVGRCCSAICSAIGRCCTWFWTPICDALSRCCNAICNALGQCCSAVWKCLSAMCSAISGCFSSVFRAISSCCSWICTQIGKMCSAIWRCIDFVVIQPIVWALKKIWTCFRLCVDYMIVRPAKAIYKYVLTPIGQSIRWVFVTIGACLAAIGRGIWSVLSAIGRGVWSVLAAIGHAIGSVFSAIWNGVLAPMGRAVRSAGRAIVGLCR